MEAGYTFAPRHSPQPADDPRDFSVVLGGPLYQFLRRAHMTGDALEMAWRRVLVMAALTWLPLLVLSAIGGHALAGLSVPFLMDIQAHTRFLVALPLLVAAELLVHVRLKSVTQEFLVRGLVPDDALGRFEACVRSAFRCATPSRRSWR